MRCDPVSLRKFLRTPSHTDVLKVLRRPAKPVEQVSPAAQGRRAARVRGRAAHDIRAQTDDLRAEEAAATVHTPLLPRAQRAGRSLNGGPGRPPDGKDASGRGGVRFRDSWKESAWDACETAVEKPADTERRRQCEEALVETLQGLARAPAVYHRCHKSCRARMRARGKGGGGGVQGGGFACAGGKGGGPRTSRQEGCTAGH